MRAETSTLPTRLRLPIHYSFFPVKLGSKLSTTAGVNAFSVEDPPANVAKLFRTGSVILKPLC